MSAVRLTGRRIRPWVVIALVAALGWQTLRARDRIVASRLLAQVEASTLAAIQRKRASSLLFTQHLAWLEMAAARDPLEIGVPIARGSQFLLLRRADDAIAAYREAARLEPRPEIDLNLGRALWMKNAHEEARRAFARAMRLNPRLRTEVPDGALP